MNILNKIIENINYRSSIKKFTFHNNTIFNKKKKFNKKRIILMEHYPVWSSLIVYSYLSNALSEKFNANIISYSPFQKNFFTKILYLISFKMGLHTFSITKSFGVKDILMPSIKTKKKKFKILIDQVKKAKSKNEILNLKFFKIKIGDLLYDGYLYEKNEATIILNDNFYKYAEKFIHLFLYWYELFNNYKILGLIASHPVREYGIPLRIATFSNIHSYTASLTFIYKHTKKKINHAFFNYKNAFNQLPSKEKKIGVKLAKKELDLKFKGKQTKDTAERIGKKIKPVLQYEKLTKIKKRSKNILIALHSIYDAPHVYGNWVFLDQYEYLKFLGKKSNELKDFNWLVKIHPVLFDKEFNLVNDIIKNYPNLKILNKNITNAEILKRGVKCVLTAYGNISYEFGYLGIPSILCSKNHPFKGFEFIKDSSNIREYNNILNNIKNLDHAINIKDICKFYYIRFLKRGHMFPNFNELCSKIGEQVNTPIIFEKWLEVADIKYHRKINLKIKKFVKSNKFYLTE